MAAGELAEALHHLAHHQRCCVIEQVGGLAPLEEDIRILRGATQHRTSRTQRMRPLSQHILIVDQRSQLVVG